MVNVESTNRQLVDKRVVLIDMHVIHTLLSKQPFYSEMALGPSTSRTGTMRPTHTSSWRVLCGLGSGPVNFRSTPVDWEQNFDI